MPGLRTSRIASQGLFLALFVVSFFALNRLSTAYTFDSEWFLRLNPLVGLLVSVASRGIVMPVLAYGIAMLVLTALFGRFFCGMICPLGTLIDVSDRYLTFKMRSSDRRPPVFLQRTKYVLLAIVALLALGGVIFPLFFDPISLLTRVFTLVLSPLLAALGSDAVRVGKAMDLVQGTATVPPRVFYGSLGAAVLFVVVLAGGFWDTRFWCQYLCPSGAFFGLVGRWSLFRRVFRADKCNSCRLCARRCPTRAIDKNDVTRTHIAECIECGVCSEARTVGCSRFGIVGYSRKATTGADVGRRHVLAGALGGLALLPALRTDAMLKRDDTGRMMRPPGAVPEIDFAAQCIACGQCMKACPTNAIQPGRLSDGLSRLNTPKIVPRVGGCEEKCYLCGHVCPTGAIRPLVLAQKQFAKIGTAVIDRHRCVAWAQVKDCQVCDEVCPYNAIEPMIVDTVKGPFKVPVVYEDLCMGCGYCEHHCPVNDTAAIVVFKFGEKRLARGEYVSSWQREKIEARRRLSDSRHLRGKNAAFGETGSAVPSTVPTPPDSAVMTPEPGAPAGGASALPPGFVE